MNIGLGTASFGTTIDKDSAFSILDAFVNRGGTVIDTANNYAFWNGIGGESESIIGEWIQTIDRGQIEIHTKIGAQPVDGDKFDSVEGLSKASVEVAIQKSLERLQTNYIDVLYAHIDDIATPLRGTWSALSDAVNSGIVKKLGISNYSASRIRELSDVVSKNKLTPIRYAQYRHTIIPPKPTADFGVQACLTGDIQNALKQLDEHVNIVAYSPFLDGAFEMGNALPDNYQTPSNELEVSRIRYEAEQQNVTPSAYVLKCIADQGILPLTMTGKLHRLESNLALFSA